MTCMISVSLFQSYWPSAENSGIGHETCVRLLSDAVSARCWITWLYRSISKLGFWKVQMHKSGVVKNLLFRVFFHTFKWKLNKLGKAESANEVTVKDEGQTQFELMLWAVNLQTNLLWCLPHRQNGTRWADTGEHSSYSSNCHTKFTTIVPAT